MFSYKQRHAVWQKVLSQGFFLPLLIFAVVLVGFITRTEQSSAATADTLNFQGRLLSSSGALVSDGSYNIAFTIYDDPTVGTNQWTETQSVTVQNGYFSVYLGSVNPFGSSVPWDQNLWMTMNVNGDGDMTPRFKLTAVPYAFRSGALVDASGNTKTADELAQLAPSTIQTVNAAVAALRLNQAGTGALLQLQGNGTDVFTIDKTGGTVLGAGVTVGNSTSTTAGTIRWSGSDLEVYDGSGWLSLTSGGSGGGSSNTSASFVSGAINVAGTTTAAATGLLTATNTTKISWTAGSTTGFVAPADGSFRSCTVVGNANRTAGTLTLRWRVNGVSVGTGACVIDATNPRTSSTTIDTGVVTFLAGDTITVAYDTAGLTPGGSTEYTTYWSVEYNSSATSSYFQNGGNNFGGTATLGTGAGTGDGLNIITNGATRLSISSTGDSTFNGLLTAGNGITISSGGLDLNTTGITNAGVISGVTSIDGPGALTIQSGGAGDLTLDSSSDVLVLSDSTLRRTASGTTTLDLLDNTSDTTFSIQNSDGTYVAGLSVEGGITATSFTGDGSGLTDLNGNAITTGTVDDARLSTNVTLLGNSFNGASQLVQLDGSG
ncbi:hypothetical protein KC960_02060, partial [Candidatus Saccharibacteria bacterium]|nr:hypothetical protein [Candidatus Saccharibacteria bacterium]